MVIKIKIMIKVSKLNWLSKEILEAEVFLTDGNFNILCFSQPFNNNIKITKNSPLHTLNAKDIFKMTSNEKMSVEKVGFFDYKLTGRVIDKKENQIEIGDFIFELDNPLPNDIKENDYVSFVCDRIDLY